MYQEGLICMRAMLCHRLKHMEFEALASLSRHPKNKVNLKVHTPILFRSQLVGKMGLWDQRIREFHM